jgi:tetratricopeptide (TPR) repeat protein
VEDVKAAQAAAKSSGELNEVCWWGATKDQALEIALRACDTALSKSPTSPVIHDSRALVLYRLGRYADALQAYDQALKLAPDHASSLYGRSLVKARLNDQAGSLADREKALRSSREVGEEFQSYGIAAPTAASAGIGVAGSS